VYMSALDADILCACCMKVAAVITIILSETSSDQSSQTAEYGAAT